MKLSELLRDIEVLALHAPEELDIADVAYDSRRAGPAACLSPSEALIRTDTNT